MNILPLMALTTCPAQAETLLLQAPAWDADVCVKSPSMLVCKHSNMDDVDRVLALIW